MTTPRIFPSILLSAALAAASPAAWALCAGLTDVDGASPFCPSVEWIKNRGVTQGCGLPSDALYCPDQSVTRLQMAAFMNRLGTAMTPVQLSVNAVPGAQDLDASPSAVVCQTASYTAATYPRRAYVDGVLSATATNDVSFAADLVVSNDGGATWQAMATNTTRGSVPGNRWNSVSSIAQSDIAANATVRFGVRLSRDTLPGAVDLADSRCQLRALVYSRDGTSSPL